MVVPGSHKANFGDPEIANYERGTFPDYAIEINLKKNDALLFVDAIVHGASPRTNPGERRVVIMRYGPSWGQTRHGYQCSEKLLDRLPDSRRKILQPIAPRLSEDKSKFALS